MSIIRTQISIFLKTIVLSLHQVTMPMRVSVEKCPPRHLIGMWELGPFERRASVRENIPVTFLNHTVVSLQWSKVRVRSAHLGDDTMGQDTLLTLLDSGILSMTPPTRRPRLKTAYDAITMLVTKGATVNPILALHL
jgi:hypothetical protein